MKYEFRVHDVCLFCGSPTDSHRVLGRRLNRSQGIFPRSKPGVTVTIFRCRRCGLVYPNPTPIPDNISDHYGVSPELYWREEYFQEDPDYFSRQIGQYLALSGKQPSGLAALDIGAGIGKGMRALAQAGFTAYGIEPSVPFRQAAIERMGIPPDRIQQLSLEGATFPEASFDFITFLAVLEHLYDPATALSQVVRWLKPDGLLVVEVPSSDYLVYKLARWVYRLTGSDFVADLSPMHPPYHLYQFTGDTFRLHGQKGGYRVVAIQYFPCPTYLPGWLAALNRPLHWLMDLTNTGMQIEVWITPDTKDASK